MAPIAFVAFQLIVLSWTFVATVRRSSSPTFRVLYLAASGGVIGMDVWYLTTYAYPAGFSF